jgi:hypothetical protein
LVHITQIIVKAECLALVGAHFFKVKTLRKNGTVCYLDKHTLPDIAESGDPPRYGLSGQLLHSPDWILGVRYNSSFFDAVAAAVRQVQVSLSLLPLRGTKTQPFSRRKQSQHLPIR